MEKSLGKGASFMSNPKKTFMSDSEKFLLKCPVCSKKMWLTNATGHRKSKHPNLTERQFELLIIEAIKSGQIKARTFEEPDKNLVTATTRITNYKYGGIRSIVSGGKVK